MCHWPPSHATNPVHKIQFMSKASLNLYDTSYDLWQIKMCFKPHSPAYPRSLEKNRILPRSACFYKTSINLDDLTIQSSWRHSLCSSFCLPDHNIHVTPLIYVMQPRFKWLNGFPKLKSTKIKLRHKSVFSVHSFRQCLWVFCKILLQKF